MQPGSKNIENPALVDTSKILLPPLHIKLGLMKNFVKAMNKTDEAFKYLTRKCPRVSEAKIREGVFVGPQIRKLLHDDKLLCALHGKEKAAWLAFKSVVDNFLGNKISENYI